MLKFFKKHKLVLDVVATGLWFFLAITKLFFENSPDKNNWNLFLGIVFLLMGIVKITDVVDVLKTKKTE